MDFSAPSHLPCYLYIDYRTDIYNYWDQYECSTPEEVGRDHACIFNEHGPFTMGVSVEILIEYVVLSVDANEMCLYIRVDIHTKKQKSDRTPRNPSQNK